MTDDELEAIEARAQLPVDMHGDVVLGLRVDIGLLVDEVRRLQKDLLHSRMCAHYLTTLPPVTFQTIFRLYPDYIHEYSQAENSEGWTI